jgi:hypothetical protein
MTEVGMRFAMSLVPIVDEHTRFFEAGPVLVGVEARELTEYVVASAYYGDERAAAVFEELGITTFSDTGPSFHVVDRSTSAELLRFDMFDEQPHYHYIHGPHDHTAVLYDPHANGDMVAWALERLRRHLPEMLRYAGADALADQIEPQRMEDVVVEVSAYVHGLAPTAGVGR